MATTSPVSSTVTRKTILPVSVELSLGSEMALFLHPEILTVAPLLPPPAPGFPYKLFPSTVPRGSPISPTPPPVPLLLPPFPATVPTVPLPPVADLLPPLYNEPPSTCRVGVVGAGEVTTVLVGADLIG